MCGFNGIVSRGNSKSLEELNASKRFIQNRGPDAFDFCQYSVGKNQFYFNHARLAIIDLDETSNQPFRKNGITLVFNGEIYNYTEIRSELIGSGVKFNTRSDTEVILESYRKWGVSCFDRFIGMFAIALHNTETNHFVLARDRAGVKPLYYFLDKDQLVFSSDLYSLKYLSNAPFNLNLSSVSRYFQTGYLDNNSTYFQGVRKIKAGTYIEVDLLTFKHIETTYWDPLPLFYSEKRQDEKYLMEELEDLLSSAFNYRMVSDVPVGVFLSGGYDSSIVSSILRKRLNHNINCYTIGFDEKIFDESENAKRVATHLGVEHKVLNISINDTRELITKLADVYDEPFGDSSAIPTLLVSRFASKDVKVVLSADGGDEIFGGYYKYLTAMKIQSRTKYFPEVLTRGINKIPNNIISGIGSLLAGKQYDLDQTKKIKKLFEQRSLVNIANVLTTNSNYNVLKKQFDIEKIDHDLSGINGMLFNDFRNYMEGDILKKVDRATMYYSIEGREPLLDHRIFEFMARVDSNLKIKNSQLKYLLKKLTHEYIPSKIMDRPKMGFAIPINKIIHKDKLLKEYFFDKISNERILKSEIFDIKKLTYLKNTYYADCNRNFITLWYLFNFLNWQDKIDNI